MPKWRRSLADRRKPEVKLISNENSNGRLNLRLLLFIFIQFNLSQRKYNFIAMFIGRTQFHVRQSKEQTLKRNSCWYACMGKIHTFRFTSRCFHVFVCIRREILCIKWEINANDFPHCTQIFSTYNVDQHVGTIFVWPIPISVYHWVHTNVSLAFQSIVFNSIKLSIANEGLCTHACCSSDPFSNVR